MTSDPSKASAISNALSSIRKDRCFPGAVFVADWKDYLFFEPYILFDPCFIEVKDLLLREESASVIALINLGNNATISESDPPTIFLEQDTDAIEYISKLKGDGSAMNWMFLMDRYVCASDRGNWSIYCEKENDVSVFALGKNFSESTCSRVADLLRAKSIKWASSSEGSELFDFSKLVPSWKSTLVAEYIPSGV